MLVRAGRKKKERKTGSGNKCKACRGVDVFWKAFSECERSLKRVFRKYPESWNECALSFECVLASPLSLHERRMEWC